MALILDQLLELQKVEWAVRQCRRSKSEHDLAIRFHQSRLKKLEADLEEANNGRRSLQIAADEKDLEFKTKQAQIERLTTQLNTLKTNREYAAMQNEIKFAELAVSRIEDEMLSDFAEIEEREQQVADIKASIEEEKEALAKATEAAAEAKGRLDAQAIELEEQQAEIRKQLPREAIDLFRKIAERYEGEAMATAVKSGGEAICQGCSMRIPQNIFLLLHGDSKKLITCQSCSRILYLGT